MLLGGDPLKPDGEERDDSLVILLNAYVEPIAYLLPGRGSGWRVLLDTSLPGGLGLKPNGGGREQYTVQPRSLAVLIRHVGSAQQQSGEDR